MPVCRAWIHGSILLLTVFSCAAFINNPDVAAGATTAQASPSAHTPSRSKHTSATTNRRPDRGRADTSVLCLPVHEPGPSIRLNGVFLDGDPPPAGDDGVNAMLTECEGVTWL